MTLHHANILAFYISEICLYQPGDISGMTVHMFQNRRQVFYNIYYHSYCSV